MLENAFAAMRREQQVEMFFDDVRDVRKWWIKGSYKRYSFRFVDVFGLLARQLCQGIQMRVVQDYKILPGIITVF